MRAVRRGVAAEAARAWLASASLALLASLTLVAAFTAPSPAQTVGGTGGGLQQFQNPDLLATGGVGGGPGQPGGSGVDGANPSAGANGGGGGGGGAGGGIGGTGGAGGGGFGATAAGGTAGNPGTNSSGVNNGAGGGGGGNGGANGQTAASVSNGSPLSGGTGGTGGAGGDADNNALAGSAGGGGAGGYGAVVTGATSNTNNSTVTGGNGGNGGGGGNATNNGIGGVGGNGGDGGIGVQFTVSGATLTNSGTIQGGNGGIGGAKGLGQAIPGPNAGDNDGSPGTNGNGAVGVLGAGLTIVNGGTIAGGTGSNGQANAIDLTGGTNSYTASSSGAGLTGSISWNSGTTLILNQTAAAGALAGAFNYSQNNQFVGSGALQITSDIGRAVIIGGSNTGFTGTIQVNASSSLSLDTSTSLGAGNISMLAGSSLFLNNIALPNAVSVTGDPTIEVTGTGNSMATYTGTSTAVTNIEGADNSATADVLRVTTANAAYSGSTVVGASGNFAVTLQGGATNAFGSTSAMLVNSGSVLDLGGFDQALGSLSGAGTVTNSAGGGTNTLSIGGGTSSTFDGVIQDGASARTALSVSNTSTVLTLSGANSYSGATTIGAGATLALLSSGSIASSGAVNLATGGIFDVSQTGAGASITTLGNTASGQTGAVALGFRSLTVTDGSTSFAGVIKDGGINNNTGGSFGVSGGTQTLSGTNTYTGATRITGGTLALTGTGSIALSNLVTVGNGSGTATFDISNTTSGASVQGLAGASDGVVTLGSRTLTSTIGQSGNQFFGAINGSGGLTVSGGVQNLGGSNGYTGVTTINSFADLGLIGTGSIASSSKVIDNGSLDLSVTTSGASITTLAGTNANANVFLGSKTLTLTAANDTFAGNISGASGNLILSSGHETLTGNNTYSGATTINGGTLEVDGSIASSLNVTVASGATLTGTGVVDPLPATTTIMSGGTFSPGNGTPGASMTIGGNLAFQSGALYVVSLNPTTSSFATVNGAATLGGATVSALFANGSYVARQYMILSAASVSGAFGTAVDTNLPSGFHTTFSYDATHAYLDLALNFVPPPGQGLGPNQQGAGNAIINFFNSNGSIPLVFGGLTPAGLTQVSGETAAGSQQTTFNAMGQFMGMMTDPFMNRGSNGASSPSGYAAAANPTDAFAMFTKAPPASFEQRWSVWASGFGGSQSTSGNAVAGTNNSTSSIFGTAVGADYLFSPNTIAGFAMAGGGTDFSVANGGTGRSDLFQIGAYVRHNQGPAYISAALAYGWQDITTNRTVTVAGLDQLRAQFNANAWSGRLEGGYRFVSPSTWGIGITPYAAAQFVTFDLPAYAEQAIVGTSNFALAYGAHDPTDMRTELGVRTDRSWAVADGILTLRGRFAWAHDYDPDRAIGATFQSLPGASFVVNGAAQAGDSALTTASTEMKWNNGWSASATFEGEFSSVTNSYAGKGVLRYAW